MKKSLLALSLISSALMVASAQAEPAAAVKDEKQVVRPQAKGTSALLAREKRSEVKKRAAEVKKKQQETSAPAAAQ